jgi:predicted secreted protein
MFDDARSRRIIFVAHCILNQNAISDGTADFAGCFEPVVEILYRSGVGICQMPCLEVTCLGLDRGNPEGGRSPVLVENSRIRRALQGADAASRLEELARSVAERVSEFLRFGFDVLGVIGVNRSPSCGVETTSRDDRETPGSGIFVEALKRDLERLEVQIPMVGIRTSEPEETIASLRRLS